MNTTPFPAERIARAIASVPHLFNGTRPPAPEPRTAPAEDEEPTWSPHDHVGPFAAAYDVGQMAKHRAAIRFMVRAEAAGRQITYREALIASTAVRG